MPSYLTPLAVEAFFIPSYKFLHVFNPTENPTRALQTFQLIRFAAMLTIGIGMARLGYTRAEIGNYEAVLFVSGLLSTFWITGLVQALLPLYGSPSGFVKTDNRLFSAFLVILGLTLTSCFVALAFSKSLISFAKLENRNLFYLMVLYLALSAPATMVEYIFMLHGKYKSMITFGLLTYGGQVLLVLLPVVLQLQVSAAVISLVAVSAFRFAWLVMILYEYSTFKINVDFIKEYLKDGLPLSIKFLISSSGLYIDQVIIGYHYDASTFAIYRFGAREIPIVAILASSLSSAMLAEFGNAYAHPKTLESIKSESLKLMHWLFPVAIASILFSRMLFPLVFGPNFSESANVFMIYCLIVISRLIFPNTVAQGFRKNITVLVVSGVEMLLNIALSLLLVKYFGIYGVAAATVIVYILEKIILVGFNSFSLGISASNYIPLRAYLAYSLITLLTFALAWSFL